MVAIGEGLAGLVGLGEHELPGSLVPARDHPKSDLSFLGDRFLANGSVGTLKDIDGAADSRGDVLGKGKDSLIGLTELNGQPIGVLGHLDDLLVDTLDEGRDQVVKQLVVGDLVLAGNGTKGGILQVGRVGLEEGDLTQKRLASTRETRLLGDVVQVAEKDLDLLGSQGETESNRGLGRQLFDTPEGVQNKDGALLRRSNNVVLDQDGNTLNGRIVGSPKAIVLDLKYRMRVSMTTEWR